MAVLVNKPIQYVLAFFIVCYIVWFLRFHDAQSGDESAAAKCEIVPLPAALPDGQMLLPTEEIVDKLTNAIEKGHTLKAQKLAAALVQIAQRNKIQLLREEHSSSSSSSEGTKIRRGKSTSKSQNKYSKRTSINTSTSPSSTIDSASEHSNVDSSPATPPPAVSVGSGTATCPRPADPFEITQCMVDNMSADVDEETKIEQGYHVRENWSLTGNHVLSGPGCIKMDQQCSISKSEAVKLCNSLRECLGFTCNKARSDCQLRSHPLKHETNDNFVAWYKPGQIAASTYNAGAEEAAWKSQMKKGSLAAPGFDWNGVCGQNGYKCVVSYGLYGSNPKYTEGAISNAELVDKIFPGWIVRIYHDKSVPKHILDRLRELGCEFILVDNIDGGIAGMFWRFLVASDDTVDRYIIRDSDSRLNKREAAAVAEWLQSGYSIHTIRDHPNHARPMNGGMWGGTKGAIKNMRELIENSSRGSYGADLDFLGDKIWPLVKWDQIAHDSYTCQGFHNSHPFPTERIDYEHVGQVFENGKPRYSDISCCLLNNPAPVACRKHKSWKWG